MIDLWSKAWGKRMGFPPCFISASQEKSPGIRGLCPNGRPKKLGTQAPGQWSSHPEHRAPADFAPTWVASWCEEERGDFRAGLRRGKPFHIFPFWGIGRLFSFYCLKLVASSWEPV